MTDQPPTTDPPTDAEVEDALRLLRRAQRALDQLADLLPPEHVDAACRRDPRLIAALRNMRQESAQWYLRLMMAARDAGLVGYRDNDWPRIQQFVASEWLGLPEPVQ